MVTTLRHDGAAGTGFLARTDLGALIEALHDEGRTVIGPTVQDGAIVYDEISSAADLPIGWRDEQAPGRYRIARRATASGRSATRSVRRAGSSYTFPSRVPIGRARRDGDRTTFEPVEPEPGRWPSSASAAASSRRCASRTGS